MGISGGGGKISWLGELRGLEEKKVKVGKST